jgi:cytochrome c oxidase subunit 2
MNLDRDPQNSAPDESLCSILVGFNFLFFLGLLAVLLILPLKAMLTGSGDTHGDTSEAHTAAGDVEPIESATAGKAAYALCATCHGAEGEGNAALHGPALAGQETWYLKRQIQKFKDGVRGTHAGDIYGMQMRPMAMTLQTDEQIDAVAEYIASLPPVKPESTLGGDVAKGKAGYMLCQACHGADAEGNKLMNGPSLQNLPDWYLVSQLKNYKAGVRGADPKDIEGMQMAPMAKTIANEAAMKDLAAYINSKAAAK